MQEARRRGVVDGARPHGGSKAADRPQMAGEGQAGNRHAAASFLSPQFRSVRFQCRGPSVGPIEEVIDILRYRLDGSTPRSRLLREMAPSRDADHPTFCRVSIGEQARQDAGNLGRPCCAADGRGCSLGRRRRGRIRRESPVSGGSASRRRSRCRRLGAAGPRAPPRAPPRPVGLLPPADGLRLPAQGVTPLLAAPALRAVALARRAAARVRPAAASLFLPSRTAGRLRSGDRESVARVR